MTRQPGISFSISFRSLFNRPGGRTSNVLPKQSMDKRLPILAALMVSCGRPGDGQEGGSSKSEWSVLQTLEASSRGTKITSPEVTANGEHRILSLMARDGVTRLWIMLDPKSPPFYKQIPSKLNYDISETELEKIRTAANPISSTYQVLESHLR